MNGWTWVAAGLAALAAAAWVRDQPGLVRSAAASPARGGRPRWLGWCRGRPDAVPMRTRVLLAVPVAAVALLLVERPAPLALLAALLAGLGVWVATGRVESEEHRRRRERLLAAWPRTWELLACCVEAGLPLVQACRAVAAVPEDPAAEVLRTVVARVDVGMSEEQALLELRDDPLVGRVVADLARGLRSGTGMTELLLAHAAEARDSHHAALQSRAKAVGVRSVLPLMTCYLPAFFLVGIVPVIGGAVTALLR